jgi:hypothetical protein
MARIISVTFETSTHGESGHFGIPQGAARILGLGADDPVEIRVIWEGGKVEVGTELRSGFEVYYRHSDPTTNGLERLPANTPITVTVWRRGESSAEEEPPAAWTDESFDDAFVKAGGSRELLERLRSWGASARLLLRYGNGPAQGPLYFDLTSGDRRYSVMNVLATGNFEWVFRGNIADSPGLANRVDRVNLVRQLADLFGASREDERADTWLALRAKDLPVSSWPAFFEVLQRELAAMRHAGNSFGPARGAASGASLADKLYGIARDLDPNRGGIRVADLRDEALRRGALNDPYDPYRQVYTALNYAKDRFEKLDRGLFTWRVRQSPGTGLTGKAIVQAALEWAVENDPQNRGLHYQAISAGLAARGTPARGPDASRTVYANLAGSTGAQSFERAGAGIFRRRE